MSMEVDVSSKIKLDLTTKHLLVILSEKMGGYSPIYMSYKGMCHPTGCIF